MEQDKQQDLRVQAITVRRHLSRWDERGGQRRFRIQYRFYMGVLLFVVVVGLPIIAFPALRARLSNRVRTLREALGPLSIKPTPAWAKVGENRYPFPKELERPVIVQPQHSGMIDMTQMVYRAGREGAVPASPRSGGSEQIGASSDERGSTTGQAAPEFRQGKVEQEAYDLLLKANETVVEMVKGNDSSLRFKSWAAAKAEGDTYLVDLVFIQSTDNVEAHYTWKVDLATKKITPESRYARTLPRS